jgi:hypothetical protein
MYQAPVIAGFEPGELLDMQEFCNLAGYSIFTIRTQWDEYKIPFELIGGRRVIRRAVAEQWIKLKQDKKDAIAHANLMADQLYQQMLDRQAGMK